LDLLLKQGWPQLDFAKKRQNLVEASPALTADPIAKLS